MAGAEPHPDRRRARIVRAHQHVRVNVGDGRAREVALTVADAQAVVTNWETESPDARSLVFRAAMSCSPISL